jgi:hypothetical protein
MRAAKKAPDLRALLGPSGFYGQGSETAYTLTGSFVRWVLDLYGRDKLPGIYRDGDFEGALGLPLDALVRSWEHFVDGLEVPEDAAGLATGRFNVPAIQHRPCGLDVARVESEAAALRRAGDREGARAAYQQVVAWIPEDAAKRRPLLDLAAQDGDLAAVRTAFWTYLVVPGNRNPVSDAAATEVMADAIARAALADPPRAATSEAHRLYASLHDVARPEDPKRTNLIKAFVSSDAAYHPALRFILDGKDESLAAAAEALPGDVLVDYLVGRRRVAQGRHAEALPMLQGIVDRLAGAPSDGLRAWVPWVRREAARLIAEAHWALADYRAARAAYLFVADLTPYPGDRARYLDWAERCAWKAEGNF